MFKPCGLIPVYDHEQAIGAVVSALLKHGLPCILVDDGSSPACAAVLAGLANMHPAQITLLRHPHNRGKGAAMITGLRHAVSVGYTHALQIDADGQHCVADIPVFLDLAQHHPLAVIAGIPVYDDSVPALRLYARYLTHVWVWINTLSLQIRDSMCGYRVYPLIPVEALLADSKIGQRMNFDTDILVRLYWNGVQVINVPTQVSYPADGISHFRVWLDNILITRMHIVLFFGMLTRLPLLLARKWRGRTR